MKISLKSIINSLTIEKYKITDEDDNINEEKSRIIAMYAILSSCEL